MAKRKSQAKSPEAIPLEPGPSRVKRADRLDRTEREQQAWLRAEKVLDAHRDTLLAMHGVVAVEVAPKLINAKPHPVPCIRVLVYSKRSRADLSSQELLPERIDGVPVDVVPASFRASGCNPVAAPLFRRWPRLQGGCTIGGYGDRSIATLACLFLPTDRNDIVLGLTAGHAFDDGEVVVQPANGSSADAIGTIVAQELSDDIDAAVVEIDVQRRPVIPGVAGAGGPRQVKNMRQDGEYLPVFMAGGCSGWRVGWARRSSGSIPVDYPSGQIFLEDYIHITSGNANQPFNRVGDSGAMLLSQDGEFAYGLVIAALEHDGGWAGIAVPLDRTARAFGLRLAV